MLHSLNAMGYDWKGNLTLSLKWDIFLNDYIHAVRTEYDFVSQPIKITETWQMVSEADIQESHTAVTTLTYDDLGKPIREILQVDGNTPVTLSSIEYDEIGRPIKAKGAVEVDYIYDIRSHLTSISSDPYTEKAIYETSEIASPSHQFLNRTEDCWGKDFTNIFTYQYDPLGRMTQATDNKSKMSESYEVDRNAAVTFVTRNYEGVPVTDAVKQFDGMKPVKVYEVTDPVYLDAVGRILPGEYEMNYDRNGRLIKDSSRDVTSITYNRFVDRPARINFGNGNYINHTYAPDGTLLSRSYSFPKIITTITVDAKGDTIVTTANRWSSEFNKYYGNFEIVNGKIRYNTSKGYYDLEENEPYQYLRNRQGSVMAVVNSNGETVQRTGLYPSGTPYILPCDYKVGASNNMTPKTDNLHIGNHWMGQSGLNFYDNTARMHDPILCDMKSGDPKFFDYPGMNHYSFCGANPVNLIDPDGNDVYISGTESNEALSQLQDKVGNSITLSLCENGKLDYKITDLTKKLKGAAKRIVGIIDSKQITVNLNTTKGNYTSSNKYFIGGAFMGNEISIDEDGNVTGIANQDVNPDVLKKMSDAHGKPGADMFHELTEAYEGTRISIKKMKSSPCGNMNNSVYEKAHRKASPQSGPVWPIMYDKDRNEVTEIDDASKIDYCVRDRKGNNVVIQTYIAQ